MFVGDFIDVVTSIKFMDVVFSDVVGVLDVDGVVDVNSVIDCFHLKVSLSVFRNANL